MSLNSASNDFTFSSLSGSSGRRGGPMGTPSIVNKCLATVMADPVRCYYMIIPQPAITHHVSLLLTALFVIVAMYMRIRYHGNYIIATHLLQLSTGKIMLVKSCYHSVV